jgi:General secretion pathway, M protein.
MIADRISTLASSLSPRDRRILVVAVPVILFLVVILAGRILAWHHEEAELRLNRALEDLAWLQAQRDAMPQQGRRCPTASWNPRRISALAGRYGITLAASPELTAGRLQLAVAGADGNRVVEFIQVLECQGAMLTDFQMDTLDTPGSVRGSLVAVVP